MEEQYSVPELRHLMVGKAHLTVSSEPSDSVMGYHSLVIGHQLYDMVMVGDGAEVLLSNLPPPPPPLPPPPPSPPLPTPGLVDVFGLPLIEEGGADCSGFSKGRWPRQETLTLLEIRTRLHHKFKEAAQKAPLWDEVSRIMAKEHGYRRSGKKCREKLENLYKYYKKTKDGKAGRQNGKHYRFFRQLEALYGKNSDTYPTTVANMANKRPCLQVTNTGTAIHAQENQETFQAQRLCTTDSLSIMSNSTEFDCSSTEQEEDDADGQSTDSALESNRDEKGLRGYKRGRKKWRMKMREFVNLQMMSVMEIQDAWLEKMLKSLEHREQERVSREEAWRKQEAERSEREHRFWASELAWIEARDAALIDALEKISRHDHQSKSPLTLMPDQEEEKELTSMDTCGGHTDNINQNEKESESVVLDGNFRGRTRIWPEHEIASLIKLKRSMEFQEKSGHSTRGGEALWEEVSAAMACFGYDETAERCQEKLEKISINYYRKSDEISNNKPFGYSVYSQGSSGNCT